MSQAGINEILLSTGVRRLNLDLELWAFHSGLRFNVPIPPGWSWARSVRGEEEQAKKRDWAWSRCAWSVLMGSEAHFGNAEAMGPKG